LNRPRLGYNALASSSQVRKLGSFEFVTVMCADAKLRTGLAEIGNAFHLFTTSKMAQHRKLLKQNMLQKT
jgi:hypothetical protein